MRPFIVSTTPVTGSCHEPLISIPCPNICLSISSHICPVYFLSHLRPSGYNHMCTTSLSFVQWCLMKHTDWSHNPQNTSFGWSLPNTDIMWDFRVRLCVFEDAIRCMLWTDVSVSSSKVMQPKKTAWSLKKGSIGCPETSVTNCQVKRLRWSRGSVLVFGTQACGFSHPAEAVGFLGRKKILSTLSFGGEVKPSVPCRSFTACKSSLNITFTSAFRQNSRIFLAHSSSFRR